VVGVVDGSHIPIVTLCLHVANYYNRQGFHSVLLQGVVSRKCLFWDFDIGWTGLMHNANLWTRTDLGQLCEVGHLSPYALVGDVAYHVAHGCWPPTRATKTESRGMSTTRTLFKV
jgi:hypothetical protein